MPGIKAASSKFLAQKWDTENFRAHRFRVENANSGINNTSPKQFPHLKLALNKIAIQEEKLAKYERENQLLMGKIRIIVKGRGTIDNWNTWSKKESKPLHAGARLKRQREIEQANLAMLKRIQKTKAVVRKNKQEEDFKKHKQYQTIMETGIKDYKSPRTQVEVPSRVATQLHKQNEENIKEEDESPAPSPKNHHQNETADDENSESESDDNGDDNVNSTLPPLPPNKKPKEKQTKNPQENKRKNRHANVPKLPAI